MRALTLLRSSGRGVESPGKIPDKYRDTCFGAPKTGVWPVGATAANMSTARRRTLVLPAYT